MHRSAWVGGVMAFVAASTFLVAAQVGGKPVSGGNPTPGTPQPDQPNLSDRITLTGCLQPAPAATSDKPTDANTPVDSRYVLASAQRVERVPAGTGGSALATNTKGSTFRLEGLDSQFSPFVNKKVEISGEIRQRSAGDAATSSVPTLLVEFIQKTASTCQ